MTPFPQCKPCSFDNVAYLKPQKIQYFPSRRIFRKVFNYREKFPSIASQYLTELISKSEFLLYNSQMILTEKQERIKIINLQKQIELSKFNGPI